LLNGRYELKNLMKKTKEYYNPIFQDNEDIEIILEKKIKPNSLSGNNNYYDPSRMKTSTKIKGEEIKDIIYASFNKNILTEHISKKLCDKGHENNGEGCFSKIMEKQSKKRLLDYLFSQDGIRGGTDIIFRSFNELIFVESRYLDSSYLFCYDVFYGKYKIRNKFINLEFNNFDINLIYLI
jgi:hypothetical protein